MVREMYRFSYLKRLRKIRCFERRALAPHHTTPHHTTPHNTTPHHTTLLVNLVNYLSNEQSFFKLGLKINVITLKIARKVCANQGDSVQRVQTLIKHVFLFNYLHELLMRLIILLQKRIKNSRPNHSREGVLAFYI